jgi:hypothetical protein
MCDNDTHIYTHTHTHTQTHADTGVLRQDVNARTLETRMGAQTDAMHKLETLNPKRRAQRREGVDVLAAQKNVFGLLLGHEP